MNFIQELYISNQVAINMALVGLAIALLDAGIEKSKAKSNSVITMILNVIKSVLVKKK